MRVEATKRILAVPLRTYREDFVPLARLFELDDQCVAEFHRRTFSRNFLTLLRLCLELCSAFARV